ncbi:MAG TPA: hypothetical protein VGM22_03170 [Methylomirabilota bacterium]
MTWVVLALPFVVWAGLAVLREDLALLALLLALELPFRLWHMLGVDVGRHTDFWGWPDANDVGITLIVVTDVIVWYVLASLTAAAWRALRRGRPDA